MEVKCKFCKGSIETTDVVWVNEKLTRYYYCPDCDRFIIRSLSKEQMRIEEEEEVCFI